MKLKIALSSMILAIFWGMYVALGLPFVTESVAYAHLDGYVPFVKKGLLVILILIGAYLGGLIVRFIIAKVFGKLIRSNPLAKKLFPLIEWGFSIAIWIIAAFFILGTIGVNLSALITGAGIGGVFFALASKEFLSNLFGSLSLIFSHNFKIGDIIRVKGYEWLVEEISLSYTRLTDKKGTVIFMPNKLIISETIENLSMNAMKKSEFSAEISVTEGKKAEEILRSIETELKELTWKDAIIRTSIDGITENGYNVTIRTEASEEDTAIIKKNVWILLKEKSTPEKTS